MRIEYNTISIEGRDFYTVEVNLPKTNLLVVGNENGYFMCGALDVGIFDSKEHLKARKVICGRSLGVKTLDDLIESSLQQTSLEAQNKGVLPGMKVKDALLLI